MKFYTSNFQIIIVWYNDKLVPIIISLLGFLVIVNFIFRFFSEVINNSEKDFFLISAIFKNKDICSDLIKNLYQISNENNECISNDPFKNFENSNDIIVNNMNASNLNLNLNNQISDITYIPGMPNLPNNISNNSNNINNNNIQNNISPSPQKSPMMNNRKNNEVELNYLNLDKKVANSKIKDLSTNRMLHEDSK